MRIGLIGAMQEEIAELLQLLEEESCDTVAGMQFHKGTLGAKDVILVQSGIGKVNMAICAQILVDRYQVKLLVNTGVAGSLDEKIDIGDFVIGTDALQHDMDASIFGDPVGQVPRMDVFSFPCDEAYASQLMKAANTAAPESACHSGRILSGDLAVGDDKTKAYLVSTFGGLCCEMEGAAMAQVGYRNGIPCLIIRAISDKADHSATMDYAEFEHMMSGRTVRVIMEFISQL